MAALEAAVQIYLIAFQTIRCAQGRLHVAQGRIVVRHAEVMGLQELVVLQLLEAGDLRKHVGLCLLVLHFLVLTAVVGLRQLLTKVGPSRLDALIALRLVQYLRSELLGIPVAVVLLELATHQLLVAEGALELHVRAVLLQVHERLLEGLELVTAVGADVLALWAVVENVHEQLLDRVQCGRRVVRLATLAAMPDFVLAHLPPDHRGGEGLHGERLALLRASAVRVWALVLKLWSGVAGSYLGCAGFTDDSRTLAAFLQLKWDAAAGLALQAVEHDLQDRVDIFVLLRVEVQLLALEDLFLDKAVRDVKVDALLGRKLPLWIFYHELN